MRFINGRVLFIIFIIMCGSLLIAQQAFGILTANRFQKTHTAVDSAKPICGEIYRAAWNRDCDYIMNCDGYKILIRGTYLSETVLQSIKNAEFATIKIAPEIPEQCSNFGEFDMQKYLAAKNIDCVVFPGDSDIEACSLEEIAGKRHSVQYYSSEIRECIKNILIKNSDEGTASVCMSIMTGDSGMLESETKTSFQKAGLSHLMAVSGAHVAYIADPLKKIISKIKTRRLGIRLKSIIVLPFVLLLAFVSGFSPSILRASLMYICMILAVVFGRRYDPLNSLGFAGIILMIINPCYVFDTGFILSFGACMCLYIVLPVLKNIKLFSALPCKNLKEGLLSGFAVSLGITPIVINMFNGFSFISILVNIIASPLAKIICTGSYIITLASTLGLPESLCRLASYPLTSVVFFLEKCAAGSDNGFPGYNSYVSFQTVTILIYYSVLIFMVLYLNKRIRITFTKGLIATGVLSAFMILPSVPAKAEFLFFDVGQGVSVLFKTRDGYCGLIDTGDGNTDISSLLRKESVTKLDFIIVSHGHADHGGGFDAVINDYNCDIVFLPDNKDDVKVAEYALRAEEKDVTVKYVEKELTVNVGKYTTLKMICYTENDNINNSSVIALFDGDWGRVVLPGDIESDSELRFAKDYTEEIDLLCLPHHGSDTSSTNEFLKTLSPEYAIISVGEGNQYGHPSAEVIDRVDDFTTAGNIYRTDSCGAVRFKFGMLFSLFRDDVIVWQKKNLSE